MAPKFFVARVVALLAAAPAALVAQDVNLLAGYALGSDVSEHAEIDLDQQAINAAIYADEAAFADAEIIYTGGRFSTKSDGTTLRTLQGFSTDAAEKMAGEDLYELYRGYWGSHTYADDMVLAALRGSAPFVGAPANARAQLVQKTTTYQNTWMYVVHELEDAIGDCESGNLNDNEDTGVQAWDEAWAFYAGSLEGPTGNSSAGVQPYRLQERACAGFATCHGDSDAEATLGVSLVNSKLVDLFHQGQRALLDGNCAGARALLRQIVPQMTIPLIQGALRYAFIGDPMNGQEPLSEVDSAKVQAELWAYTATFLPQLAACSPSAAKEFRASTEYVVGNATPLSAGYARLYEIIHDNLGCLNILCSEVGGNVQSADGTTVTYRDGTAPCMDATSTATVGPNPGFGFGIQAGYVYGTDVSEHAEIDLDQQAMEAELEAGEFAEAESIYTEGRFSEKGNGTMRTLQGFSTQAAEKMAGEDLYELYRGYWGSDSYADDFVMAALSGSGQFEGADDASRYQLARYGSIFQNVWMYVVHELEDAIADCESGDLNDNADTGVHAWDEAWAFYAGSMAQEGSLNAVLPYFMAQAGCANKGTCHGDSDADARSAVSLVNSKLVDLFHQGQNALRDGNCNGASQVVREIVAQMTVPLVQVVLGYAWFYDPNNAASPAFNTDIEDVSYALLWAFSAALLPQVAACSPAAARELRSITTFTPGAEGRIAAGFKRAFDLVRGNLACMNIQCSEVGGMVQSTDGISVTYYPDTEPCTDPAPVTTVGPNPGSGFGIQAGYVYGTDVSKHAEIDLDLQAMQTAFASEDYAEAQSVYTEGRFSEKSDGTMRTLQGFSTQAAEKMAGEGLYELYRSYWGSDSYADDFVMSVFNEESPYDAAPAAVRQEAALWFATYQNTWMYVVHELEDAISDCKAGNLNDNTDPGVHAWDEAWAFFAGSLESRDGSAWDGLHMIWLGKRACKNLGTCHGDSDGAVQSGDSLVHSKLLDLFHQGQMALMDGNCHGAERLIRLIVPQMTIPLVQGTLGYGFYADPNNGLGLDLPEAEAQRAQNEAWAFTAAYLPQLAACDAAAAEELRSMVEYAPNNPSWLAGGYARLFELVQSNLACMSIECAEVGGLVQSASGNQITYFPGAEPCKDPATTERVGPDPDGVGSDRDSSDGDNDDDDGWGQGKVAGIAIGMLLIGLFIGGVAAWFLRGTQGATKVVQGKYYKDMEMKSSAPDAPSEGDAESAL